MFYGAFLMFRLVVVLWLVASLLICGCAGEAEQDGSDPGDAPTDAEGTAAVPDGSDDVADRVRALGARGVVESPAIQDEQLANGLAPVPDAPLFVGDYADPFVLAVGDELYLYSTNTVDQNVPVLTSEAGTVAEPAGDALPELPSWTRPGLVWAPSVLQTDSGFAMYYTSLDAATDLQCVGAAHSESPLGPFVDDREDPFVCQRELGGTIDASPFTDEDGTHWLLYKSDGNCCDITTSIWIRQLEDDGLGFTGEPVELLRTDKDWEGPLIEGPSMTRLGDDYWLLYSANDWNSSDYRTGAARCESPTGPCTKLDSPWLGNHGEASGPGGAEDFTDVRGRRFVVYHAWVGDAIGYESGGVRALFAVPLDLVDGLPIPRGINPG